LSFLGCEAYYFLRHGRFEPSGSFPLPWMKKVN